VKWQCCCWMFKSAWRSWERLPNLLVFRARRLRLHLALINQPPERFSYSRLIQAGIWVSHSTSNWRRLLASPYLAAQWRGERQSQAVARCGDVSGATGKESDRLSAQLTGAGGCSDDTWTSTNITNVPSARYGNTQWNDRLGRLLFSQQNLL